MGDTILIGMAVSQGEGTCGCGLEIGGATVGGWLASFRVKLEQVGVALDQRLCIIIMYVAGCGGVVFR